MDFIAAERWRELPAPEGPFLVQHEDPPPVFLDDYDLAVIGMYELDDRDAPA
jgi:hypothetical protein